MAKFIFRRYSTEGCILANTCTPNGKYEEGTTINVDISYVFDGYEFKGWYDEYNNLLTVTEEYEFTLTKNIMVHPVVKKSDKGHDDENYDWMAYVKDQTALNSAPKTIVKVVEFEVGEDLCAGENGSMILMPLTVNDKTIKDIANGDVICLTNPSSQTRYYGIITSIEPISVEVDGVKKEIQYKITTSQMNNFYNGNWIYDIELLDDNEADDKSWHLKKYELVTDNPPTHDSIKDKEVLDEKTYLDTATSTNKQPDLGNSYTASAVTWVRSLEKKTVSITFSSTGAGNVYVDGNLVGPTGSAQQIEFRHGWTKIEVLYNANNISSSSWNTSPKLNTTFQKQQSTEPQYPLEAEFVKSLQKFASGQLKDSTWTDTLFAKEKNSLLIKATTETMGKFETVEENSIVNMGDFIYTLYDKYGIMLKFNIPYNPWEIGDENGGTVEVFKPNYPTFKMADNVQAIMNLAPSTEMEETNRLVIFSSEGKYRATYVYTTGGIVKEPTSEVGRLSNINTEIVFSDDEFDTLIKSNLPEEMFNHEINFTLVLDNKIYKYDDFKLGMPLEIYVGNDKYTTVLTGYKIVKDANQNVLTADFTCGKIRTELTKKLFKKFGVL